jgi:hypothetical protein
MKSGPPIKIETLILQVPLISNSSERLGDERRGGHKF